MLLNILTVFLATVSAIFIVIGLKNGEEYAYLVEDVNEDNMFFPNLYVIGFYLSDHVKIFKLNDNLLRKLKTEATLMYNENYAEYYTRLAWAQFLSLSLFVIAFGCAVATFISGTMALFILLFAIIMIVALWDMSMNRMSDFVKKRTGDCLAEFPTMVSKLALLINAGMILRDAWILIAKSGEGSFYELMQESCDQMENGASEAEAIQAFGTRANSPEIKKFTSTMIQGMQKGNAELTTFLLNQSNELWEQKKQLMLQKGEAAAGKLVAPLGLTFGGIILIIAAAAMQSMSL